MAERKIILNLQNTLYHVEKVMKDMKKLTKFTLETYYQTKSITTLVIKKIKICFKVLKNKGITLIKPRKNSMLINHCLLKVVNILCFLNGICLCRKNMTIRKEVHISQHKV